MSDDQAVPPPPDAVAVIAEALHRTHCHSGLCTHGPSNQDMERATAALADAAPAIAAQATAAERELLAEAAEALWECAKAALTVKPTLDTPYPDAPEWTPYTRWMERPAHRAHDLRMKIRKHLRQDGDTDGH